VASANGWTRKQRTEPRASNFAEAAHEQFSEHSTVKFRPCTSACDHCPMGLARVGASWLLDFMRGHLLALQDQARRALCRAERNIHPNILSTLSRILKCCSLESKVAALSARFGHLSKHVTGSIREQTESRSAKLKIVSQYL
jgi:hypothetical protein